jgi:hypothetical protein
MNGQDIELMLTFDPLALARCFLVADILAEEFDEPRMEYGLLGVADERAPLHVLATPLLVGQSVTPSRVEQPGHQVFRMREEVDALAHRMQRKLVPIAFIHRHNGPCDASSIDRAFLRGVFIDQVSTVVSFNGTRRFDATSPPCTCEEVWRRFENAQENGRDVVHLASEYSVAFSLIVNQLRQHEIYVVRKATCLYCMRSETCDLRARITPDPRVVLQVPIGPALRAEIAREIEAKIRFASVDESAGIALT